MPSSEYQPHPRRTNIRQSPPVDLSKSYDVAWINGKTIIVTGGASGFGAAFVKKWAEAGATLIVADINVIGGTAVVAGLRKETGNDSIYFVECDVRDWQAQVRLFREAARLSPHRGIDCVIANAGIAGIEPLHEPVDYSAEAPKQPDLKTIDVNLTGVVYTTQLALWWLKQNPGSKACSLDADPTQPRDRHLLLVGSIASLGPIIGAPIYGTTKHAVLGLFRSLRASSFIEGVRTNIIFPYFVETPINPAPARLLVAGGGMAQVEDVVDAASRLVADTSILGRGLAIAPKSKYRQEVDGEWTILPQDAEVEAQAIWEAYADDWEDTELFSRRVVMALNGVAAARGWFDFFGDVLRAIKFGIWRF